MEIREAAKRAIQFINEGSAQAAAAAAADKLDAYEIERALQTITSGERLLRSVMYLVGAETAQLPSEVVR